MELTNGMKKVKNILVWIILIIILCFAYNFYKKNNFNDFVRSEVNLNTSKFKRDNKIKYSKNDSYEIISEIENDATFYKTIKVEKNTPYKVTCMVKTENVISKDNVSGVGAQIVVLGTTERSIAISGTNDWQKIEFIFNSKNREKVDIGFRLGGYLGNCIGKAWFSDFTLEEGVANESNEWKFACLVFENTNVEVEGKKVEISMTDTDISDINDTIKRFQDTCSILSENKMIAKTDVYKVKKPITKLTYDNEFGYFVSPEDIDENIRDIIKNNNYDHIFIVVRLRK